MKKEINKLKPLDYLYNCAGCKKDDTDYPDKKTKCNICEGSGKVEGCTDQDDNGYCNMCDGEGEYVLYCRPIAYHHWARNDAYGIYTGLYCDDCYENNYPYRKDRYYDPAYAGERMEPDE